MKYNNGDNKQRFSIRKLTIGTCSVLLSTLFLTMNFSHEVHAADIDNEKTSEDAAPVKTEDDSTIQKQQADLQAKEYHLTASDDNGNKTKDSQALQEAARTNLFRSSVVKASDSANNNQGADNPETENAQDQQNDNNKDKSSETTNPLNVNSAQSSLSRDQLKVSKAATTNIVPKLNSAFDQDAYLGYVVQGSDMNKIAAKFLTNGDAILAAGGKITWDGPSSVTGSDVDAGTQLSGKIIVTYPDQTQQTVTAYFTGTSQVTANANLQAGQKQTGFLYVPKVGDSVDINALDINNTAIFNGAATNSIIPTTDSMGVNLSAKVVGSVDTSTIGFHELEVEVTDSGNSVSMDGVTVIGSPYIVKVPYLVQTLEPITQTPTINIQKSDVIDPSGSSSITFHWPWLTSSYDYISGSGSGIGRYFYKDYLKYFALGGNLYVSSGQGKFGTIDNPLQEFKVQLANSTVTPAVLANSLALTVKINWIDGPKPPAVYTFKDQNNMVLIKKAIYDQLKNMNSSEIGEAISKIVLANGKMAQATALEFSRKDLQPVAAIQGSPTNGKYTATLNLIYGEGSDTANGFIPAIFSTNSVLPKADLFSLLQKYNPQLSLSNFYWGFGGGATTYAPTRWINVPTDIYSVNVPKAINKEVNIADGPQSFTADELQDQYLKQLTYGTTNVTSADWPKGTTFEFVGGDTQDGKITMDAPGETKTTQIKITLPGGSTTTVDVTLTTAALQENQREVKVRYLDSDNNNKLVFTGEGFKIGEIGNDVSFTLSIPENYELKPGQTNINGNTLTYKITDDKGEDGIQYANVYLIHKTEKITDPSQAEIQETRTATVNYVYGTDVKDAAGNVIHAKGSQAATSAVLDVFYTRSAIKDLVTGDITYGNWQWDSAKNDDGYANGYKVVSGSWTSLPTSWNPVTAAVPTIDGYTAWTTTSQSKVPTNKFVFPTYVNNGTSQADGNSTAYTSDADTYEAKPVHTVWYLPVETQARTITENYHYWKDGQDAGEAAPSSQIQVFYSRNATDYDATTGNVTYGTWKFDKSKGDSATPGFHVISGTWNDLTGGTFGVAIPEISGYTSVTLNNTTTNSTLTFGTPTYGDSQFTSNTGAWYYRNSLTTYYVPTDELNKNVIRTIKINNPSGESTPVEQIVKFIKTPRLNTNDNGVVFGAQNPDDAYNFKEGDNLWWNSTANVQSNDGNWDSYTIPTINGYTTLVDGVPATKVAGKNITVDSADETVNVTYVANTTNVMINHAEVDQTYNGQLATIPDGITHLITPAEHITLPEAVNQVTFTKNDYSFANIDGTIIATPTEVGTYHIILNQSGLDKLKKAAPDFTFNYDPKTSYVIYQITPAQANATLSGTATATYNDQDVTSVSSNQVKVTIHADPSLTYYLQSGDYEFVQNGQVVTPKNAGTYEILLTENGIKHITALGSSNYNWFTDGKADITQNAKLEISKATPTVTINGAASKTYDGTAISDYAPQVTISAPGTNPVTLTTGDFEFNDNGTWITTAPVNAGTYQVRLTQAGLNKIISQNVENINWAESYNVTGDYTIDKATANISLTSSGEKTYDGQLATMTINGTDVQVTNIVSGEKVNLTTLTPEDLTWTDASGHVLSDLPSNVGTYKVTFNNNAVKKLEEANPNYTFTASGSYIYTIKRANATVNTTGSQTLLWSGSPVSVDPSEFTQSITTDNGITLNIPTSVKLDANDYDIYDAQGKQIEIPTAVGNYYVKLNANGLKKVKDAIVGNSNYTWNVAGLGNYNIEKAHATIILNGDAEVTYTGNQATVPVDANGNVEGISVTLTNGKTYNLKPSDLKFVESDHTNVGNYKLELSDQGLANIKAIASDEYDYTYNNSQATLHVKAASATYKLSGTQSETYTGKAYSDRSLIPTNYSITITTNNGQTLAYKLQDGDLGFESSVVPTNRNTYKVILTSQGLQHLQDINSNFDWNAQESISIATFEITAKDMTVNITGEANTVYNGKAQGVASDQLDKIGFTWAGEITKPEQITSVALTTDDFEYYKQDSNGKWSLITDNGGLPLHAGTYGLKLKQSVVDALNVANAEGNYTFTNGESISARFIINQRQARVTLTGSQTASYTENGALDISNFKVQLTDTSDGKPITVNATTLANGDLLIKGYSQGNYPSLVGTYDVEMTQQLISKLESLYPDYKFESDEVIPKLSTRSADKDSITNFDNSDVVDRNNDGKYIITPLDAEATVTGNQTIKYGQAAKIDYAKYSIILTNNKNGQPLKDIQGNLLAFTLQDGDLEFEKTPDNVGNYKVVLTNKAVDQLKELGLNPTITDTANPAYPSSGTYNYEWANFVNNTTFSVVSMPVNIEIANGKIGPQTSIFGNPINIDTSHYVINLTTEDGSVLTYDLQPGDLVFEYGTPKNAGTFDLELSQQGLTNIKTAINGNTQNYSFNTPTSTATYIVEKANPTITISANGQSQKIYDGQSASIKNGDYTITIGSNDSQVPISILNGSSLQFKGNTPINVGTYEVELTQDAIDKLNTEYPNFDWSKANTVVGKYDIIAAQAKAELSGSNSMTYNGQAATINNLNNGGTIQVSIFVNDMTYQTINYKLKDGDYTWTNGYDPINADATPYELSLNKDKIFANLQAVINQKFGLGQNGQANVTIDASDLSGTAEFTINKQDVAVTFHGSQTETYKASEYNNDDLVTSNYSVTLANGKTYTLQDGDIAFARNQDPLNAGEYQVILTKQGQQNIQADGDLDNQNYNYTFDNAGNGSFIIKKANVTDNQISFNGDAEKIFDGAPIANYQPIVTITAPGASEITLDPADYEYQFVRHDGTIFDKAPYSAGVYDVKLTQAGINKIKADNNDNLDWSQVELTGIIGTYTIKKANASADLQGNGLKDYDGIAVTSGEIEHQGFKIVVTVPKADGTSATQTIDYTLRNGDYTWIPGEGAALDENGRPINVGTYTLKLTDDAVSGIMAKINSDSKLSGNVNTISLVNITGSAIFTIKPKSVTLSQTGSSSQVFNQANDLTVDQIVKNLSAQGLVNIQTLNTTGLTMADFTWSTDEGKAPISVGTYTIKLNEDGLSKLQGNLGNNYALGNLPAGSFTYIINSANANAKLSGLAAKIYDGNSITTEEIDSNGNIQVKIVVTLGEGQNIKTESLNYTLQDDDYIWINGLAPINSSTTAYGLKLSDTAKAHIQNVLNAKYGQGNVLVNELSGSAHFMINPFMLTITTTGQITVSSGTTTIPNGAYHLNISGNGQMPTGWSGIEYNNTNFGFDGIAPTADTKSGIFTVNYMGGQAAWQELLGPNYEVTYIPAKDNYIVQNTTPIQGTQVVQYIDQAGSVITSYTLKGDKDSEADFNVAANVPTNWQLINPADSSAKITISGGTTQFEITHKLQDLDPETKIVTRTIIEHIPGADEPTKQVQSFEFTRTAKKDLVTGKVIYGSWNETSHTFGAVTPQLVDGYTASPSLIAELIVNPDSGDTTVDVYYTKNPVQGQQVIRFVDSNDNVIKTLSPISGIEGSTVSTADMNLSGQVPINWKLADGQNLPNSVTINNGYTDIKIVHATTTQTSSKLITRIINVISPDDQIVTTKQEAQFSKTDIVDLVTGKVTSDGWKLVNNKGWDEVTVQTIAGYTPTQSVVKAEIPTIATENQIINITYTANEQAGKISYIDENGKEISSTKLTGKTGEKVTVSPVAPAGWKIVSGQDIPSEVTASADGIPTVTVKVEHATVVVQPNDPKTPSDKLPDNPDKNYPSGVSKEDLNKTITRTVKITNPDGSVVDKSESLSFERTATVDEVTGEVTYGEWTPINGGSDAFGEVNVPEVPGYTASQNTVPEKSLTNDEITNWKDTPVNVTYTANEQSGKISYVDENGKEISSTELTGKTGEEVTVTPVVPAGWKIVSDQDIPSEVTATADGIPTVTVKVEHATVVVQPDDPKTPSDKLPDNPDKNYPSGVSKEDLNKTITRTVKITNPDGSVVDKSESLSFERTATVDEVTGKVTYGEWTPIKSGSNAFGEVNVPEVPGYTASQNTVPEKSLTNDEITNWKDTPVNVTYTANRQSVTITYKDQAGKVIKTDTVTGGTGSTVDTNFVVPAGWKLAEGENVPSQVDFTYGKDGKPNFKDITVTVDHATIVVKPDDAKTANSDLPTGTVTGDEYKTPGKYPAGVSSTDLNKEVTRTITITNPITGGVTTITQTTKFTRSAVIDLVTGKVTYTDWVMGNNEWSKVELPSYDGYVPVVSPENVNLDSVVPTVNTTSETVTVTYNRVQSEEHKTEDKTVIPAVPSEKHEDKISTVNNKVQTTKANTEKAKVENKEKKANKLPQTGAHQDQIGWLGALLAGMGLTAAWGTKKKRKQK